MKKLFTFATAFLLFAQSVFGQNSELKHEKITGAFGLKFGEQPDGLVSSQRCRRHPINNDWRCNFKPKVLNKTFNLYILDSTAITQKVHSISATASVPDEKSYDRALNIVELLASKYGLQFELRANESTQLKKHTWTAIQLETGVKVTLESSSGYVNLIELLYEDTSMKGLVEKERVQLHANSVDDSGL